MPSDPREAEAPTSRSIPLAVPNISGREWEYVKECLDTGWVSSVGSFVDRFEQELARAVGAQYAVATTSGTAALHVALQLAGVEADDEVIVPALTFIAPANAVRYCGAWPVFLDVTNDTWQLDPHAVAAFLREECEPMPSGMRNRRTGRRVRAILPVHLLGHPVDLDRLRESAATHDLRIVEDGTEALGARYRDQPVGSGPSTVCFSFNGNKLLTTGGGGMLCTNDAELARRARYLTTQAKDDPLEFVHGAVGYNYRLTNVQAAIGCAQLERLDEFLATKRRIANGYRDGFADIPGIQLQAESPWAHSSWWLPTARFAPELLPDGPKPYIARLQEHGIQARPLWQPLNRSPAHRESASPPCPTAERIQSEALSLPCSTSLAPADQQFVIDAIRQICGR